MFIDNTKIKLQAGKGGNGIVAWRREKYIPKGGPYGGDGGVGGSVTLKVDTNLLSLENFRNKKLLKAENGHSGGANNRQGRNGQSLLIKVPIGTIIKDLENKNIIFEFTQKDQTFQICKGGKGGYGNIHFKSSTNQAPNTATLGAEGEAVEVELELKLIADVGLVGMPNAGKSTLMKKLTKAKVKVAPYPFTTLVPNIGLMEFEDFSRIFIADIPGIILNAHKNKGLGLSFLKHIERTNVLIYLIDSSAIDENEPLKDFEMLQNELKQYNTKMAEKPFLVLLNKIDITDEGKIKSFRKNYPFSKNTLFEISALLEKGLNNLKATIQQLSQVNGKRFF